MYTLILMLTLSFKQNFVKNSLRVHQERLINQAWDLIMKHAGQVSICSAVWRSRYVQLTLYNIVLIYSKTWL